MLHSLVQLATLWHVPDELHFRISMCRVNVRVLFSIYDWAFNVTYSNFDYSGMVESVPNCNVK